MAARGATRSRRAGVERKNARSPWGSARLSAQSNRSGLMAGGVAFARGERRGRDPSGEPAADGTAAFCGTPSALRRELPSSAIDSARLETDGSPANAVMCSEKPMGGPSSEQWTRRHAERVAPRVAVQQDRSARLERCVAANRVRFALSEGAGRGSRSACASAPSAPAAGLDGSSLERRRGSAPRVSAARASRRRWPTPGSCGARDRNGMASLVDRPAISRPRCCWCRPPPECTRTSRSPSPCDRR